MTMNTEVLCLAHGEGGAIIHVSFYQLVEINGRLSLNENIKQFMMSFMPVI